MREAIKSRVGILLASVSYISSFLEESDEKMTNTDFKHIEKEIDNLYCKVNYIQKQISRSKVFLTLKENFDFNLETFKTKSMSRINDLKETL